MTIETPTIKNFAQFLQSLEDGRLNADLTAQLKHIAEELTLHADSHGKASGALKIAIAFKLTDGVFEIGVKFETKLPEAPRGRSIYWLTGDCNLTPQNPRQMQMFGPIRDAAPSAGEGEVRAV